MASGRTGRTNERRWWGPGGAGRGSHASATETHPDPAGSLARPENAGRRPGAATRRPQRKEHGADVKTWTAGASGRGCPRASVGCAESVSTRPKHATLNHVAEGREHTDPSESPGGTSEQATSPRPPPPPPHRGERPGGRAAPRFLRRRPQGPHALQRAKCVMIKIASKHVWGKSRGSKDS